MEFVLLPLLMAGLLFSLFDGGSNGDAEDEDPADIEGTDEADTLSAIGPMSLDAGAGDDVVTVSGAATVSGGEGNDDLLIGADGNAGAAALYGGSGNDALLNYMDGIEGESTLDGGDGDDFLYDFHDGDQLFGGDGADRLVGAGEISMTGGAGNDIFNLWADEMPEGGDPLVITDYVAGEDEIALFLPPGEWLSTMAITSEVVDGSTIVSVAFDQDAAAFPQGYDNDTLSLDAPEDFSFVLQGVTDFDPNAIKFLSSSSGDTALRPLENFEVLNGTADDDAIDVYSTEYSHNYIFGGEGADTITSGLWNGVSGGEGDDVIIHHLVADPANPLPFEEQIFPMHGQTYGGEGNDLIVFEDDFAESFYGYDIHQVGGFEDGEDQLALIVPQVDAGDVEVTYGTEMYTDFVTATVTTPEGTLTIILQGVYVAPSPGSFLLFENEAAVLAGNSYAQV